MRGQPSSDPASCRPKRPASLGPSFLTSGMNAFCTFLQSNEENLRLRQPQAHLPVCDGVQLVVDRCSYLGPSESSSGGSPDSTLCCLCLQSILCGLFICGLIDLADTCLLNAYHMPATTPRLGWGMHEENLQTREGGVLSSYQIIIQAFKLVMRTWAHGSVGQGASCKRMRT